MTIWWSTPVPTAMMIPAIAARSRSHPTSTANPSMSVISDIMVNMIGSVIFIVLYRSVMSAPTPMIAVIPASIAFVRNPSPSDGLIVSTFTTLSCTGSDPVMSIVCNRFIFVSVCCLASCCVLPCPDPDMVMSVTFLPLSSDDICSVSTFSLSRYSSSGCSR